MIPNRGSPRRKRATTKSLKGIISRIYFPFHFSAISNAKRRKFHGNDSTERGKGPAGGKVDFCGAIGK
jgi:hypothetical protein